MSADVDEAARAALDTLERDRLLRQPGVFAARFGAACARPDCGHRIERGQPIRNAATFGRYAYEHAEHAEHERHVHVSVTRGGGGDSPAPEGEVTWVLAMNRLHFLDWCEKHGINPLDRDRARYVLRPANLRHLRDATFLTLPGWEANSAYRPLHETEAIIKHSGKARP